MRFKVKGRDAVINHSWVDDQGNRQQKLLREGEELVGLTPQQAESLRNQVEPMDDEAKAFLTDPKVADEQLRNLRTHEQLEVLERNVRELEQALEKAKARLAEAQKQAQTDASERAKRGQVAKGVPEKPQEPPR